MMTTKHEVSSAKKLQKVWLTKNAQTQNTEASLIPVELDEFPNYGKHEYKLEQGYYISAEQLRDVIEDSYYECIEEQPIEEAKKQILKELGVEDE